MKAADGRVGRHHTPGSLPRRRVGQADPDAGVETHAVDADEICVRTLAVGHELARFGVPGGCNYHTGCRVQKIRHPASVQGQILHEPPAHHRTQGGVLGFHQRAKTMNCNRFLGGSDVKREIEADAPIRLQLDAVTRRRPETLPADGNLV